jgi:hypothetical protein
MGPGVIIGQHLCAPALDAVDANEIAAQDPGSVSSAQYPWP